MKVTIKDIAERAGVSVSAVSFALNNKPGVSRGTKDKIHRVADELGYAYHLNKAAGSPEMTGDVVKVLKLVRHGHTINASHSFFIDAYIEGINEIAHQQGITIEIGTFGEHTPLSAILATINQGSPTIGYLVLGTELSEDDMRAIIATDRNIVFMDTLADYLPGHFVTMNNTDTVFQAISHLKEFGHTKIGLIKSSVSTQNFHLRERAFNQVMQDLDLAFNEQFTVDVDSTFDGAYKDMLAYLDKKPTLPTAFFATNDIIALGVMKALHERSFNIPEDISLVGFDNIPMSEMSSPPLTTIDVYKHKIAQHALQILLSRQGSKPCHTSIKTVIGGRLIVRASVKNLIK
jgi:LacI family transcriptional regulator